MSDFLDEVENSTVQDYGDDLHSTAEEDSDADAFGQLLSLHLDRAGMDNDQSLKSQTVMMKKIMTAVKAIMNIFMKDTERTFKIDREEDSEDNIRIEEDEDTEVHNEEHTEEDNKDKIDKDEDIEFPTEDDTKEGNKDAIEIEIEPIEVTEVDTEVTQEDTKVEPEKDREKAPEQDSVGTSLGEEEHVEKDITPVRKPRKRRRGTRGKGRKIKYKNQNGLTGTKDDGTEAPSQQTKET